MRRAVNELEVNYGEIRRTASLALILSTACEYSTEGEFVANNSVVKANVSSTNRPPPTTMTARFPVCCVVRHTTLSASLHDECGQTYISH